MQLKLTKIQNRILSACFIVLTIFVIYLFSIRNNISSENMIYIIIGISVVSFIFVILFKWYERYDIRYIERACLTSNEENGYKIALAKLIDSKAIKTVRNSSLVTQVIVKLNVVIYDHQLKSHQVTIYEKFSVLQQEIPNGFFYVTYDKDRLEDSLIIPNLVIGKTISLKPLIDKYESSNIGVKYLHAYYNRGIILAKFQDVIGK